MARQVMDERTLARLAEELQGAFTEGGQRDLRKLRLVDLETEVLDAALGLARQTMSAVLAAQAKQVGNEPCCPTCQQPLEVQPPQPKALKTRAGRAHLEATGGTLPGLSPGFFSLRRQFWDVTWMRSAARLCSGRSWRRRAIAARMPRPAGC